jgi:hypothetical protein
LGGERVTYYSAGDQIDQDTRLVGLGDNQGEKELRELADPGDGIQIGLAQSSDAHDA